MPRGHPALIPDGRSVRAKRGGDLTGPDPTDRGQRGTEYHLATTGDGVPVARAATGAILGSGPSGFGFGFGFDPLWWTS